jgi:hypothetical protein
VAAAIAAHEAASAEARRALDALDAAEAKRNTDFKTFEERDGAPASAKNVNAGKTGRYGAACPCAACVAHRSTHCLAAKNAQWKWAALRDAPIPKKKAPTIWDDVAETAMEATRQTR